jgi:hypothetical protein
VLSSLAAARDEQLADAPRLQGQQLDSHQGPLAREDIFPVEEVAEPADELQAALGASRERGRRRVAEILAEDDMLSAEAFADLLGVSRVTVHYKSSEWTGSRSRRAKTDFRFPSWQLVMDRRYRTSQQQLSLWLIRNDTSIEHSVDHLQRVR